MSMRIDSVVLGILLVTVIHTVASGHEPGRALSLGDQRIAAEPKRGLVMSCVDRFPGGGGAHRVGEWIRGGFWYPDEKPVVEGRVSWPEARLSISLEGGERVIRANALPRHLSGEYPIRPGSRAYAYDRNPNSISSREVLLRLPAEPLVAAMPGCVPMGVIGVAVTGAAIFNAFDALGRDAPAYEIQDLCNGHPERSGRYHYHDWSPCIPDSAGAAGRHSDVAGFMLDGFPIYGPKGEGGVALTNADLDDCHGHRHAVMLDGSSVAIYHYHFTREYPYTIGCFRGRVDIRSRAKPLAP